MPIGKEELVIRGSDGNVYVITSSGDVSTHYVPNTTAHSILTTTSDSGKTSAGLMWLRTDV